MSNDRGSSLRVTGDELDPHTVHSVLRERTLEHVFVGELLRLLWRRGIWDVEVSRSEFDGYGYDLVLTRGEVVRHVQLKTKRREANRPPRKWREVSMKSLAPASSAW